jgi:hypothetical protein
MRSNPPAAVTWGGCHVPSKTALHEQGALTDDEFATAKAKLLGR